MSFANVSPDSALSIHLLNFHEKSDLTSALYLMLFFNEKFWMLIAFSRKKYTLRNPSIIHSIYDMFYHYHFVFAGTCQDLAQNLSPSGSEVRSSHCCINGLQLRSLPPTPHDPQMPASPAPRVLPLCWAHTHMYMYTRACTHTKK